MKELISLARGYADALMKAGATEQEAQEIFHDMVGPISKFKQRRISEKRRKEARAFTKKCVTAGLCSAAEGDKIIARMTDPNAAKDPLAEGLEAHKRPRGAPVDIWRKARREDVINRASEHPNDTHEKIAEFILETYGDPVDLRTMTNYVTSIRNGRNGFGRKI